MAKRTRPKKPIRRPSARVRRSLAAQKGWATRRRTFAKRSRAAKKGAKTRKARFYLKREKIRARKQERSEDRQQPQSSRELPLRDFVISVSYRGRKGKRSVDFVASATTREDALQQLFEDKPWTEKIPWQKVSIHAGPVVKESHKLLSRLETKSSSRRKRTKSK